MFSRRLLGTGIAVVLLALQLAGCGTQGPATVPAVSEPTTAPEPTAAPTTTPETVATATAEPTPRLEIAWQTAGDPNPFNNPVGVTVDAQGNVYVMDTENYRVQKFDGDGKFVSMWGSEGSGDGQFSSASSWDTVGRLGVDSHGNVYVLDALNYRVQKFDSNGNYEAQWGSEGEEAGQFLQPFDIAIDQESNIYVCDRIRPRIQKFDAKGRFLLSWGEPGYKDGQFTGEFCTIAVNPSGNIVVADNSGRLQSFDANGNFLSKMSPPPVNNASINFWNIDIDKNGNLYVVDVNAERILKLDPQGQFLASWGGEDLGLDRFINLEDIAVDDEGNIYLTDTDRQMVLKLRQS